MNNSFASILLIIIQRERERKDKTNHEKKKLFYQVHFDLQFDSL